MIKVLIVEDNIEKLRSINSLLTSVCNIDENDISYGENIKDGRNYLMQNQYDLVLLDLVLPTNIDSEPTAEAGMSFLDEIYYNPNINIPVHIIGLTEFDDIYNKYHSKFEDKLWGLINFNLSESDWKEKLKSKVFYLQSFKKNFQSFIKQSSKYDIAIVTALNIEFEQLRTTGDWKKINIENDPLVYYTSTINTKNNNIIKIIACSINQMGMQAASAVSSKIITKFNPGYIFVVGICGGIKDAGVNIGDIIVASQCWDYEAGKINEDDKGELIFKPNMLCINTNQGALGRITDFSNNTQYLFDITNGYSDNKPNTILKVHFGPVGSGPYVLSSKNYLKKLQQSDRKLLGIDMEGYGVYKACEFHPTTVPIFIKAVSDFGDETKQDNFHKFCSYVSAKFAMNFIYHLL